jgi:hypothetical protein
MNPQENNSDSIQLLEESDPEWVKLWDNCKNKKKTRTKQITLDVIAF